VAERYRYRFQRTRADGKTNESTSSRSFEKWLKEREEGDRFYVGRFEWVECAQDATLPFGKGEIPHVTKVAVASAKENL
jgi:hypothetical protein